MVTGKTNTGKTTIAHYIAEVLSNHGIKCVVQDFIPGTTRNENSPEATAPEQLKKKLESLRDKQLEITITVVNLGLRPSRQDI